MDFEVMDKLILPVSGAGKLREYEQSDQFCSKVKFQHNLIMQNY